MSTDRLHAFTGCALLLAALGIVVDAWANEALDADSPRWLVTIVAPGGPGDGTIGLIPAYLGVVVGMIGLLVVLRRAAPVWTVVLAGIGVIGMFAFWGSYPDRATYGGLGSILIGVALLELPSWGRAVSPIWVASGVLGVPELVEPGISWGPVSSFTLLGAAIGVTGAFLVWGPRSFDHGAARHHTPARHARRRHHRRA